jgi:hypothetical protein
MLLHQTRSDLWRACFILCRDNNCGGVMVVEVESTNNPGYCDIAGLQVFLGGHLEAAGGAASSQCSRYQTIG